MRYNRWLEFGSHYVPCQSPGQVPCFDPCGRETCFAFVSLFGDADSGRIIDLTQVDTRYQESTFTTIAGDGDGLGGVYEISQWGGKSLAAIGSPPPGNHFTQPTAAFEPDLQLGDGRGDVNRLLYTNDPTQSVWATNNCTPTTVSGFGGFSEAYRITADSAGSTTSFNRSPAVRIGGTYTFSIFTRKGSGATEANRFGVFNQTTVSGLVFIALNFDTGEITYTTGSSGASVEAINGR